MSERNTLATLLSYPAVRSYVVTQLGLGDVAADRLVDEIARRRQVRTATAAANQAVAFVAAIQTAASIRIPTAAESSRARYILYRDGLATPPRRPTSDDRCRANAARWGF